MYLYILLATTLPHEAEGWLVGYAAAYQLTKNRNT
jgi:hypothetical protein